MSAQTLTRRLTTLDLAKMKTQQQPIACLTAYDYPSARFCEQAGVDVILIGDSMNNVVYGEKDTLSLTVQDMIRPVRAVVQATTHAMIVADMPFLSYQTSLSEAVVQAGRFVKECGAQAVKLEGGSEWAATIETLVRIGIPVMAHIGLTPQRVHAMGGYRMHGKQDLERKLLLSDAKAVQNAGAYAVVLECVEPTLAEEITRELSIPTIGIGSGNATDGQILVYHDLLGLTEGQTPKFVQPTAQLRAPTIDAISRYVERVKDSSTLGARSHHSDSKEVNT